MKPYTPRPGQKGGSYCGSYWGATYEEAKAAFEAGLAEQRRLDALDVERRQPRAFWFENNGKSCIVEYTQDDGQRVSARYTRGSWSQAPAEVTAENRRSEVRRPSRSKAKVTKPPQSDPARKPRSQKPASHQESPPSPQS
jgi:hypothetical protein